MNAWRPSLTLDAGDGRDLLPPTANAPTRRVRESVERDIRAFNQTGDPHRAIALQARLRASTPGFAGPVVQFDAGLAMVGPIVLPRAVQTLAEDAAHILGRVGTWHRYPRHLSEYALAFAERYGEQAEVPLLELLAVETGLGPPTGYLNPIRRYELNGGGRGESDEPSAQLCTALAEQVGEHEQRTVGHGH